MSNNYIVFNNAAFKQRESIGLVIENDEFKFIFPYNYIDASQEKYEDYVKEQILKLLELIDKYGSNDISQEGDNTFSIPLNSMLFLVQDFLNNGVYKEPYQVEAKDLNGKINWKKTIKKSQAYFDGENVFYKDYVVGRTIFASNKLFEVIQKFCVMYSINVIGWYFNLKAVDYENYDISTIGEFIDFLVQLQSNTFLDYKKELIFSMLAILNYIANNKSLAETQEERREIFTNYFHTVFENLVVEKLSNVSRRHLKSFYPSSKWRLFEQDKVVERGASRLRPDAILVKDNFVNDQKAIIIIDAKYYGYGYNKNSTLPATADVEKQITYAEYLHNNFDAIKQKTNTLLQNFDAQSQNYEIYNVFVLPTADAEDVSIYGKNNPEWITKENRETYETVYLMGVNLHSLINSQDNELVSLFEEKLKELIQNASCR